MCDRRDKLTGGVNQRPNLNQKRRVGAGDHSVVANFEPSLSLQCHQLLLIDKYFLGGWPAFIPSDNSTSIFL